MSSFALSLILIAAFIHVIPHAAIKGARDGTAFVWWMLLGNALLYSPVLLLARDLPPHALIFIVASGVTEVLYLYAISRAYATGALSIAYPLARGSAPLFLLASAALLLHEPITIRGAIGIFLIAAGVYLINLPTLGEWLAPLRALREASPRWAIVAGLMTAGYTTIDKVGIRYTHPLLYIYLALVVTLIVYTPLMLVFTGWQRMRETAAASPWRVVIAGATMPLAYVLVLIAMKSGTLASYAGSVREVSVIVASFTGVLLFGEKVHVPRVLGAISILVGIVLIASH